MQAKAGGSAYRPRPCPNTAIGCYLSGPGRHVRVTLPLIREPLWALLRLLFMGQALDKGDVDEIVARAIRSLSFAGHGGSGLPPLG